jgi:predicted CoA-binding protein
MEQKKSVKEVLGNYKRIAVVGISADERRDSFRVAQFLQQRGYTIIPVNPKIDEVLGEKSYPDLTSIPEPIDVVDVFRRSDAMVPIAREAVKIGAKVLWMQIGVSNDEAAEIAQKAGLTVVQDRCIMQELAALER